MPPLETMALSTVGVSRCGEVFVTNNADKWTFFCSYCQQSINDIGVFICHIRLDHLDSVHDFQAEEVDTVKPEVETEYCETSAPDHMPTAQGITVSPSASEGVKCKTLIKDEETLSQFSFDSQTFNPTDSKAEDIDSIDCNEANNDSNKNSMEMMEEYLTIIPGDPAVKQDFSPGKKNEVLRVLYSRNGECGSIINETMEDVTEQDTNSIYSLDDDDSGNEDITSFETNDDNRASCSKRKKEEVPQQDLRHTCEFCNMSFKFGSELDYHMKKIHNHKLNEMPLKCRECKKVFRSVAGFKNHSKSHDEKNNIQCPICQVKHTQNYFITHVLSHESDKCFPCQVCGKIFNNNEERVKHWKTHADEMPFKCNFCYRRFRKPHYLTHHMKSHFQYQCQFCPTQFNAVETQKPPYACTTCENVRDIKDKLKKERSLANKISKALK